MRSYKHDLLCVLFGGLAITLAYFVSQSPPSKAEAQPEATNRETKWQYARLLVVTGSRNDYASLSTPAQEITKVNLWEVFAEASGREDVDPKKFRNIDMLNFLGSQGWEVATHAVIQIEDQRVARVYTLKKPRI